MPISGHTKKFNEQLHTNEVTAPPFHVFNSEFWLAMYGVSHNYMNISLMRTGVGP